MAARAVGTLEDPEEIAASCAERRLLETRAQWTLEDPEEIAASCAALTDALLVAMG
jgi:predicted ATPase